MIRKTQAALAIAALFAAPAFAATFDANIELDTDYRNLGRGATQGGRVEFNAAGKAGTDGFVAGRASFLAKKDGTAGVDDMWAQFGNASGDLKLGRFEAADIFPVGKDTVVEDDGAAGYRNMLRGRFGNNDAYGDGTAHAALTLNAGGGLAVELGVIAAHKNAAVRPVVSYSIDGFTFKAGIDSGKTPDGQKIRGGGVTVGTTLSGAALNLSYNAGKVADLKGSSVGLNATIGAAGVGYIYDRNDVAGGGSIKENNVYVAYSVPLFNTGATITPALAYSKATGTGADGDARITGRVRINYAF
ncbi:MAG: carbohydrate porin [Pseudomonadota bacterium]|nr:carbohydrate porin [Pseudomonadota bacterium]